MDKIKEKLHIGSSKKSTETDTLGSHTTSSEHGVGTLEDNRDSIDSELASMPPQERVAYLKEFEDSDKHDTPKKGGLLEKLIARGNKRTEDQIAKEREEREASQRQATQAQIGPGAGSATHSATGAGGL